VLHLLHQNHRPGEIEENAAGTEEAVEKEMVGEAGKWVGGVGV